MNLLENRKNLQRIHPNIVSKNRSYSDHLTGEEAAKLLIAMSEHLSKWGTTQLATKKGRGLDEHSLKFVRERHIPVWYSLDDSADLEICYDISDHSWTHYGTIFGTVFNSECPLTVLPRFISNSVHQQNTSKKSFFHWAEKYCERYGTKYAQLLYQLGQQLVGSGTMSLDLETASCYARWTSQTTEFSIWFSLKNTEIGTVLNFGFYEEPSTHVFEFSQKGCLHILEKIDELERVVTKFSTTCSEALRNATL